MPRYFAREFVIWKTIYDIYLAMFMGEWKIALHIYTYTYHSYGKFKCTRPYIYINIYIYIYIYIYINIWLIKKQTKYYYYSWDMFCNSSFKVSYTSIPATQTFEVQCTYTSKYIFMYIGHFAIFTSGSASPWIPMDSTSTYITVIASQTATYREATYNSVDITYPKCCTTSYREITKRTEDNAKVEHIYN